MPWEGAVSNREHVIDEGEHGGGGGGGDEELGVLEESWLAVSNAT